MLPQSLVLLAIFAGPPDFEPNNGPLTASELQILPFVIERSQTHDFAPNSPIDGRPDEDWVIVEPIPGTYVFNVTELAPAPAGTLTLNAQLFDASALTNPNAVPIAEYNPCGSATEGANVLDSSLSLPEPSFLLYVRVVECNGRTGGSYKIGFEPFEFTSPAQPVRISGTVTDQATMNTVGGVFLVDSTNSATFSDSSGNFSLVTLADTEVTIEVFSEQWNAVDTVVIPPQPETTSVTGVAVTVSSVQLDLAIAAASADEALAAGSGLDFVVSLTGGTLTDPFAVNYSTAPGSADGSDFVAASGTLIFGGGNPVSQTVSVFGLDDAVVELDENFTVTLSLPAPPAMVTLSDATAVGTLRNDDTATVTLVANATADEGGTVQFDVALSQAVPQAFTVPFATANGSAIAPGDYTGISAGQLNFAGTQSEVQTITVASVADTDVELDETFTVTLAAPGFTSVLLGNAMAIGTIANDDTTSVSIVASAIADEGSSLQFNVTLQQAVPQPFTVPFATANGSAVAPADFTAINAGQLSFAGNQGEIQVITVATGDDSDVEPDETLSVSLGAPSFASVLLGNAMATGTIRNDDAVATVDADLSISKTDGLAVAPDLSPWTYTIVVSNLGPDDAPGTLVSDVLPPELMGATWMCTGLDGGTCPASGSDDIQALVDLPAAGTVTFTLDATLAEDVLGVIVNTATVSPPAGVNDPDTGNNSATDFTGTIDIFASGFESPPAIPAQWHYNENQQIWIQVRPGSGAGQPARRRVAFRGADRLWVFLPWETDAAH